MDREEGMPPPHALFGHASVSCCFLKRTMVDRACFLYLFEPFTAENVEQDSVSQMFVFYVCPQSHQ